MCVYNPFTICGTTKAACSIAPIQLAGLKQQSTTCSGSFLGTDKGNLPQSTTWRYGVGFQTSGSVELSWAMLEIAGKILFVDWEALDLEPRDVHWIPVA